MVVALRIRSTTATTTATASDTRQRMLVTVQHAATHSLLHTARRPVLVSHSLWVALMPGQHGAACYAFTSHLLTRAADVVKQVIVVSRHSLRLLSLQPPLHL